MGNCWCSPIGICQFLRLTPRKFVPAKPSFKKKSFISVSIGFKKIYSAGVCMTCHQLTIQLQTLVNKSLILCPLHSYPSLTIFDFTSSLLDVQRETDWFGSRGGLLLWLDQLAYKIHIPLLMSIWALWLSVFFWFFSGQLNLFLLPISNYLKY